MLPSNCPQRLPKQVVFYILTFLPLSLSLLPSSLIFFFFYNVKVSLVLFKTFILLEFHLCRQWNLNTSTPPFPSFNSPGSSPTSPFPHCTVLSFASFSPPAPPLLPPGPFSSCLSVHRCGAIYWSTGNPPVATPPVKSDSFSAVTNCQAFLSEGAGSHRLL